MSDFSDYILSLLKERTGADRAIPADNLAGKASAYLSDSITGRDVRQVIHDLRVSGLPICSGPASFYWPISLADILTTADNEFKSEARSMLQTARKLRQSGRALFGGQLGMF